MMDFASYLMTWLSLLTEKTYASDDVKKAIIEGTKATTMIQTEPLLVKLKSLNWSSTQNQKVLD